MKAAGDEDIDGVEERKKRVKRADTGDRHNVLTDVKA